MKYSILLITLLLLVSSCKQIFVWTIGDIIGLVIVFLLLFTLVIASCLDYIKKKRKK